MRKAKTNNVYRAQRKMIPIIIGALLVLLASNASATIYARWTYDSTPGPITPSWGTHWAYLRTMGNEYGVWAEDSADGTVLKYRQDSPGSGVWEHLTIPEESPGLKPSPREGACMSYSVNIDEPGKVDEWYRYIVLIGGISGGTFVNEVNVARAPGIIGDAFGAWIYKGTLLNNEGLSYAACGRMTTLGSEIDWEGMNGVSVFGGYKLGGILSKKWLFFDTDAFTWHDWGSFNALERYEASFVDRKPVSNATDVTATNINWVIWGGNGPGSSISHGITCTAAPTDKICTAMFEYGDVPPSLMGAATQFGRHNSTGEPGMLIFGGFRPDTGIATNSVYYAKLGPSSIHMYWEIVTAIGSPSERYNSLLYCFRGNEFGPNSVCKVPDGSVPNQYLAGFVMHGGIAGSTEYSDTWTLCVGTTDSGGGGGGGGGCKCLYPI